MPISGDTYTLPAGTIVPNGAASDAPTQHNAPFTDVQSALNFVLPKANAAPTVKAVGTDIDAATDNAKYVTPFSLAGKLAGTSSGINIGSPVERSASFTVTSTDFGSLQVLTPADATTLDVTLPPTTGNLNKAIAFWVPASSTSGRCRFKATSGQPTSIIIDWPTDTFVFWHGEIITIESRADGWHLIGWQKRPFYLETTLSASNVTLVSGSDVELSGWQTPSIAGTYIRHGIWGLDGGSPQKVILPRRGVFELQMDAFCSWGGTAPSALYAFIPNIGTSIVDRAYADFIQTDYASLSQGVIPFRQKFQQSAGALLAPNIRIIGSTSPIVNNAAAPAKIKLVEIG